MVFGRLYGKGNDGEVSFLFYSKLYSCVHLMNIGYPARSRPALSKKICLKKKKKKKIRGERESSVCIETDVMQPHGAFPDTLHCIYTRIMSEYTYPGEFFPGTVLNSRSIDVINVAEGNRLITHHVRKE